MLESKTETEQSHVAKHPATHFVFRTILLILLQLKWTRQTQPKSCVKEHFTATLRFPLKRFPAFQFTWICFFNKLCKCFELKCVFSLLFSVHFVPETPTLKKTNVNTIVSVFNGDTPLDQLMRSLFCVPHVSNK